MIYNGHPHMHTCVCTCTHTCIYVITFMNAIIHNCLFMQTHPTILNFPCVLFSYRHIFMLTIVTDYWNGSIKQQYTSTSFSTSTHTHTHILLLICSKRNGDDWSLALVHFFFTFFLLSSWLPVVIVTVPQ